jgi:tetratricopeptide (TPR) repeat protein
MPSALACKETAVARRKLQDNCVACHMPKSPVRDAEHAVHTDHSIPRQPRQSEGSPAVERSLTEFWKRRGTNEDDRDLGLAYASVARTDSSLRRRAIELLSKAEARGPDDVPVLTQLAQLHDQAGNDDLAIALCERILRLDPAAAEATLVKALEYNPDHETARKMLSGIRAGAP